MHQTLSVSLSLYMLWYVSDYLLCRSLEESPRNTSIVYFWWFFSWCEDRLSHGRDLARRAWARRQTQSFFCNHVKHALMSKGRTEQMIFIFNCRTYNSWFSQMVLYDINNHHRHLCWFIITYEGGRHVERCLHRLGHQTDRSVASTMKHVLSCTEVQYF